MANITIKYTAITAPTQVVSDIFRHFDPKNAAADNPAFEGTYYDTNVDGRGVLETPEEFFKNSIAHPGVILALKRAQEAESHQYVVVTEDADTIAYYEEIASALADQGFTITVGTASTGDGE
jgi:hypothetical protein